jgi:hypothetical protein
VVVEESSACLLKEKLSNSAENLRKPSSFSQKFLTALAEVIASRTLKLYISYAFTSWVSGTKRFILQKTM